MQQTGAAFRAGMLHNISRFNCCIISVSQLRSSGHRRVEVDRTLVAVLAFVVGYNLLGLWAWRRAARFRRPGLSAYARLGLGLSLFRADNYTAEGQPARRRLVLVYAAALPALLLWLWISTLIA
jgi:hypothetical protein